MTKLIIPKIPFPSDAVGEHFYPSFGGPSLTRGMVHCPPDDPHWKDWWYFRPHQVPDMIAARPSYL